MRVLVGCEYSGRTREAFRRRGTTLGVVTSCPQTMTPHSISLKTCLRFWLPGTGTWLCSIHHAPTSAPLACTGTRELRGGRSRQRTPWPLCRGSWKLLWKRLLWKIPSVAFQQESGSPHRPFSLGCSGTTPPKPLAFGSRIFRSWFLPRLSNHAWLMVKKRWSNQTDSGQNKLPPSADRWKIRSETYLGISEAMASQWSNLVTLPAMKPLFFRPERT